MNRKNLTAAVLAGLAGAAGIAGTAQAVNINPDGLGQVLIYPYYTTNGGNSTVLSVVNTSEDAKAVKVRFLEGQNTREVLDFNLYLSAWDVWAAAIVDDAGTPTLVTTDTSCTVPNLNGSQAFLPYALGDGGSEDISRAAEGHFEMIEMGTLIDEDLGEYTQNSATAATHDSDGVPNDCDQLVDAWTDPDDLVVGDEGYWLADPFVDMAAPSGGLFGGAAIVDVATGKMYSYDATAINGFATTVDANDELHQEPGSVLPSLNSGDVTMGYVFLDNGAPISASFGRGVDAVSYVFQHDAIMNEYTTEGIVNAGTEWVVTFPTKHFYVYDPSHGMDSPLDPFTSEWYVDSEDGLVLPCEVVALDTIWDREEQTIVPGPDPDGNPVPPVVSPAPPPVDGPDPDPIIPFDLCYETNVIRFGSEDTAGDTTEILGSSNFTNIDNTALGFEFGWVRLELDDYQVDVNKNGMIDDGEEFSREGLGQLQGLPVAGFAVQKFENGVDAGALRNYGGIFKHKATRKIFD